jgi:hypothetical protein
VPEGFGGLEEFHRLMTELPEWAAGFPIAAKVWTRQRFAKSKSAPKPLPPEAPSIAPPEPADSFDIHDPEDDEDDDDAGTVPLNDLICEPIEDGKVICPFHHDTTPSLQIYADHFHCFVCGAHGGPIDWLMRGEGMERDEAAQFLAQWDG